MCKKFFYHREHTLAPHASAGGVHRDFTRYCVNIRTKIPRIASNSIKAPSQIYARSSKSFFSVFFVDSVVKSLWFRLVRVRNRRRDSQRTPALMLDSRTGGTLMELAVPMLTPTLFFKSAVSFGLFGLLLLFLLGLVWPADAFHKGQRAIVIGLLFSGSALPLCLNRFSGQDITDSSIRNE